MKLATWNVNSLKARMPRVLDLLEVHQRSSSAGYQVAHHSGGRWAGVALAARAELTDVCVGLAGEPSREEARWLEATVDGVRAVSVYVPNDGGPHPDALARPAGRGRRSQRLPPPRSSATRT